MDVENGAKGKCGRSSDPEYGSEDAGGNSNLVPSPRNSIEELKPLVSQLQINERC